jgi:hypothetical protein
MSYVEFASEHAEARLSGSERAHLGCLTRDISRGLLAPCHYGREIMARVVKAPDYLYATYRKYQRSEPGSGLIFDRDFTATFNTDDDMRFRVGDRTATALQVRTNTAVLVGNDVVRLMARLDVQCELHGWVGEANREWLARLIDDGRASGLMRPGEGWEGVAALLRNGDGGPVVTSYSVTGSFPDRSEIGWVPPGGEKWNDEALDEAWYALSAAERWALGVGSLRPDVEWSPERHAAPHFGGGLTVFDLTAELAD